jgi:excisionase family DNA binding protein
VKAELTLPPELVDEIANKVIERLKPLIAGNGKQEDDVIFDVRGLAEYLKVSTKWIYERTQFKEIPHQKVKGLLRFRKKDIDRWLNSHSVPAINSPERILRAIK